MITKQQIQEAAEKYGDRYPENSPYSFADGALWALKMLEPMHDEAASQLEQLKYIVRIPGLEFDWRDIEEKYNWVAVDEDGGVYKYTVKPEPKYSCWGVNISSAFFTGQLTVISQSSYVVENWRKLIFERPK